MSHTVEILSVGTELLLGSIVNSDAQALSRELTGLGLNVLYHSVVGDNPGRLRAAVELAKSRADVIVTTGGLGPTCDDLTKQTLAECFGKQLVFHPECAEGIRCFFHRQGREMTDNNLQQAYLPEGCTVLDNAWGTAPGCAFEAAGTYVVMLPGPPRECLPMFRERAMPWLARLSEGIIRSRTLRVFGLGESAVESLLRDRMNELTNPTLAPYAKEGEVELRVTAKANTEAEADALIAPVEEEVRALLGGLVYGVDVSGLEQVVLDGLRERGLTLGTAESCTGGLIAKRITDVPGAASVFKGGVVSYHCEVKAGVLGVSQALLDEKGAVCAEVAEQMAQGARKVLGCDVAVSATGVAGPDPDDRGNPVGLVFTALAAPDGVWVKELNLASQSARRDRTRNLAANHALDMVRRWLAGLNPEGTA
ncbi:MAG: competence/damage-inducible protein A [Oscillospiraceae bacterium]|nr:competence/damage-inducible protein A [Oscillospiraceae bacterium]MDE7171139.1 competence/damage-inducible protein A [Oscillospiraceae bacterium]